MDSGELYVGEVMKTCNVSQSLVYKWRADVKASRNRTATVTDDAFFAEIVVGEEGATSDSGPIQHDQIQICGRAFNLSLPAAYPVEDLVKVILAIEGHA